MHILINTLNVSTYLKLLEPLQQQLSGVYSTATLIITILLILWVINIVLGFISRVFALGKTFGTIYRKFFHKYLRAFIYTILNIFSKKTLV
ncbi:hypothetical protein [Prochlorococcus marinus]|uniref:hypothetical protein n=1 Tax=Prochlorococcus marinus TaxID=1219 RepID=UPI0022B354E8|nr:hypothetical protein [Prochlorococcus marinus]